MYLPKIIGYATFSAYQRLWTNIETQNWKKVLLQNSCMSIFPVEKKFLISMAKDREFATFSPFWGALTGNCILTWASKKSQKKVQITVTKEWREVVQVKITVSHALSGWNGRELGGPRDDTHMVLKKLEKRSKALIIAGFSSCKSRSHFTSFFQVETTKVSPLLTMKRRGRKKLF